MTHERPPLKGENGYGMYMFLKEQQSESDEIMDDHNIVMEVLRMSGSTKAVNAFNRIMEKL